jgi:hypothetical protein
MQIDEDALPVVLVLPDQVYDFRRRMYAPGSMSIFRVCRGTLPRAYRSISSR